MKIAEDLKFIKLRIKMHENLITTIKNLIEGKNDQLALSEINKWLEVDQNNADAYYLLGLYHRKVGDAKTAKHCYQTSLEINRLHIDAQFGLANVCKNLGDFTAAQSAYLNTIKLNGAHDKAYFNLGVVYQMTNQTTLALNAYQTAISIRKDYPEALNNLGNLHKASQQYLSAKECYEKALAIKPLPETYYNLGTIELQLNAPRQAIQAFQQAVKLKPNYLNAWLNLALTLEKNGKYSLAVDAYREAITLQPNDAEIYYALALTYKKMNALESAIASYAKVLEINPDYTEALGALIQNKMHACDWENLDVLLNSLICAIEQGDYVVPFNLLATPLSAAIQKKCAESYTHAKYPMQNRLTNKETRYEHRKIKLGYFSADFHNHATAYLMADLFASHDRSRFEIIAFSFGPVQDDEMAVTIRQRFDQFHEVRKLSDFAVAQLTKSLEIDIAIDLKGYTRGARPNVFAYKPAPILVSYLGYPGTLGANYFDYIVADQILIPSSAQIDYTEKVAYMPDSYQVNAKRQVLPPSEMTRAAHGLPDKAFVYCSFNNNFKITSDVFEIWMRLLKQTPNSVLWLFEANIAATKNLSSQAQRLGIDAERLIFAKKVSQAQHLNRYYHADIVLDTFYYNAHTTTSDALWVGCPVVTCMGHTFPARVAASILTAHGMEELITNSKEEYEALALTLAQNPTRLKTLREKINQHKQTHPLFDSEQYTLKLENLYQQMQQRHQLGLVPDHITI